MIFIKVFADDFHLQTLDMILQNCGQLHNEVDIKTIIVSLVDRLANFAQKTPHEIPDEIKIFEIFSEHTNQVIKVI